MWRDMFKTAVAVGAGRHVGGWTMLVGALFVLGGIMLLASAVAALEDQAADLDPSQTRAGAAGYRVAMAGVWASIGLTIVLIGGLIYLVSTIRARRRHLDRAPAPRVVALLAVLMLVMLGAFTFASPDSPVLVGASLAMGGRGAATTVMYEAYEGELTGGTLAGQATTERTHNFSLNGHTTGAIRVRLGSGGMGSGSIYAIGILEAQDGAGGWREVARTRPEADSIVDVPSARYDGDLRVRVQISDGTVGQVRYVLGISFAPAED